MEETQIQPALYLLPVGMSDTSPTEVVPLRNIKIMRELRYFIVENVRTARRWLRRCDPGFPIDEAEFVELNTRTRASEVATMIGPLREGKPIGVMSEAGCPAVADPGADVVAVAQRAGLKVVPLAGPSSILMGLMGSGFNGQSFCFHGYLPIDEKEKRQKLLNLERESEREDRTQIFIETPYRNNKLLGLMAEILMPDTEICVAADITDPEKESIETRSVAQWRKTEYDYSKRPAIFLMYRKGLRKEGKLIYSTKKKR